MQLFPSAPLLGKFSPELNVKIHDGILYSRPVYTAFIFCNSKIYAQLLNKSSMLDVLSLNKLSHLVVSQDKDNVSQLND